VSTFIFIHCWWYCYMFRPFSWIVFRHTQILFSFWIASLINIVTCWGTWPLLNTKCNMLEYWRRRSVCYSGLFMTSLVVTTISLYNELWPSDVASRSGPGSSALVLRAPLIWSSLICLWSHLGSAAFISFALVWSGLLSSTVGWTRRHLLEGFCFPF
jgi:hypothetical protein